MSAPFAANGLFGPDGGLIMAVVIGIGFGFVLERAGLGSSRKLTGQFYFTDLSVFKVMLTAIITAMLGLFWLSRVGFLDLSEVHMLPTYILPQTVGGLIFGAGFVMGGYCPGTSCVGAASGRLDGGVLLLGMLGGIFMFGEAYPWLAGFYNSTPLGDVTLGELLGLQAHTMVFLLVAATIAVFTLVGVIEKRRRAAGGVQ